MARVQIDNILEDRKKLTCALCKKRGVCVQCGWKKCVRSFHPWCLMHAQAGLVHRTVKDGTLQVTLV